jgi:hypothetical protein
MRAIRAALSTQPDMLLIEASSEAGGVDVGKKMNEANLDAMLEAGVSEFTRMFGGR